LSKEGLPLGIQLAGGAFAEGKLLAMARWCEKGIGVGLDSVLD
jgi:Asp-tRNA(Asn)/Glu-tRNA(Gln) amidotransferase A subunit family amidase